MASLDDVRRGMTDDQFRRLLADACEAATHSVPVEAAQLRTYYEDGAPGVLLKGPAQPTKAERAELLARLAMGEHVEIEIEFRAFQQQAGVINRNAIRFKPSILRKLAKSFAGVPFLRDHAQDMIAARGGTVTRSEAAPIDGGIAFDMTARLTAPWAVEAVLLGNIDRFSIGWYYPGRQSVLCSLCDAPLWASDCWHRPGEVVTDDTTGAQQTVEIIYTVADGVEVSGVSVPAVVGTQITEIRAALSMMTARTMDRDPEPKERTMDLKKLAAELGLNAETATEAEVFAAIGAQAAAAAAARDAATAAQAQVATLGAEVTALLERDRTREVEALFSQHASRFPISRDEVGKLTRSPLEVSLRALAAAAPKGDLANVAAILGALPEQGVQLPGVQSVPGYDRPTAPDGRDASIPAGVVHNPVLASQLEQLGLTVEDYVKYGPHAKAPAIKFGMAATRQHTGRN